MRETTFDKLGKIVLVEDESTVGSLICSILETHFDVSWLTEGLSVLPLVQEFGADLILLDIGLPDISGFEVCKLLKADPATQTIPIIFVTGHSDPNEETLGLRLGAVDFVTKPIRADMLLMRVKSHIELKKHRDDLRSIIDEKTHALGHAYRGVITSMAILAECRDEETGKHVQRAKNYVRVLAENLHLGGYDSFAGLELELLTESAVLHDVGKIGIRDSILEKPHRLTAEEFEAMKKHTLLGRDAIAKTEQLFGTSTFLRCARDIAEFHHERWDGTGYPHGIGGTEIPLCARIMALADVYDALTMPRSYKRKYSHDQAVHMMTLESPGHFDPQLLNVFRHKANAFQVIHAKYQTL
ncbi:MAG: response regulator [Acidobacteria bacterium]|nr:response regulator [Acidobacteriota bacterium]